SPTRPRHRDRHGQDGPRRAGPIPASVRWLALFPYVPVQHLEDVDWKRKDDRGVLFGCDLAERLQVAQRDRERLLRDDGSRLREFLRGHQFALGVNDLRALLPLRLGLTRDRTLHVLWPVDVLHLDRRY